MSSMMSESKNFVRANARHAATMSAGPLRPPCSHFCMAGASNIIRPKLCTSSRVSALTSGSSSSFFSSGASSVAAGAASSSPPSSDSESIQANSFSFFFPAEGALLPSAFASSCSSPASAHGLLSSALLLASDSVRGRFSSALLSAFESKRLPRSSSFAAAHLTVVFLFVLAHSRPAPVGRVFERDVCIAANLQESGSRLRQRLMGGGAHPHPCPALETS
mmetsp:Transcript_53367/g.159275  ORF Transcript_53367/g.159275 Transcript_53367/m.159275 type:complete len:220 (-) Transcript_53367:7-666(-)